MVEVKQNFSISPNYFDSILAIFLAKFCKFWYVNHFCRTSSLRYTPTPPPTWIFLPDLHWSQGWPKIVGRLRNSAFPWKSLTPVLGARLYRVQQRAIKSHYQSKVFVCVSVISGCRRIIVPMQSIGFYYYLRQGGGGGIPKTAKPVHWNHGFPPQQPYITIHQLTYDSKCVMKMESSWENILINYVKK